MKRRLLNVFCALALANTAYASFGAVRIALLQHAAVWGAILIETSLALGAALIPLLSAGRGAPEAGRKIVWAWLPCIAYVLFISVNFLFRGPYPAGAYLMGLGRLLPWVGITWLYLDLTRKGAVSGIREPLPNR